MDSGSSSGSDEDTPTFKIVVLGDGSVGKTTLIQSFCNNYAGSVDGRQGKRTHGSVSASMNKSTTGSFDASGNWSGQYKQTLGVDFYAKELKLPSGLLQSSNGASKALGRNGAITLHIWDVGGQSIGGSMLANYLYECDAVCFVYDVTNLNSFKNLEEWYLSVSRELEKSGGGCADHVKPSPQSSTDGFSATAAPAVNSKTGSPLTGVTPVVTNLSRSARNSSLYADEDQSPAATASAGITSVLSSVLRSSKRRSTRGLGGSSGQPTSYAPLLALVGTKVDSPIHMHAVSRAAHDRFAQSRGLRESFLVSSRTGDRVAALFLKLTADILGHQVSTQDLNDFGFASACLDSTVEERKLAPRQLMSASAASRGIGTGSAVSPSTQDDCTVM